SAIARTHATVNNIYNNNATELYKVFYEYNNNVKAYEYLPLLVKQVFSFTDDEQEAVIESHINSVEKAFYKFLVDNEYIISSKIIEFFTTKQNSQISSNFANAD
ncbi:17570_t:CDS:1, partial [Racocetra persica]